MTSTLAEIRKTMFEWEPSLGVVYDVSALAPQTLTVARLATGRVQSGKYIDKWLRRPQAADAANRNERIVSNFAASTGVLTHEGAAYTDTTATGETVEIHEYQPYLVDQAVQKALDTCRFRDEAVLPVNASGIYWLNGYDWIDEPSVIHELRHDGFPVLSNNRFMQQWNGYSPAGALVPDYFDLTGVFTRTSGSKRGKYILVSPNSAWEVSQTVGLLEVDVDNASLRGQTVTAVLVGSTSGTDQARVRVTDGTQTVDSAYLPDTGVRSEVSAEINISDSATTLRFYAEGDETTNVSELYLCYSQVNDGVRVGNPTVLNRWPGWALNWVQGQPLNMQTYGIRGYGTRFTIVSQRPYARFPESMVQAGTADALETDAPAYLIAARAIALFFEDRMNGREGNAEDARKFALWNDKANKARAQHMASSDGPGFNDTILEQMGSRVMARGIR